MRLTHVLPPNFTGWCWVTLNQVPSMNTIKHLVVTNRTHTHKLEKCVLAANSVWALTEPRRAVSCHPAPGHAIVIMTVILVIIRKRRSWNWGVNQHSGGNPNKTEEEQTGRRLMWTMGKPWRWTTLGEKDCVWWRGREGEGCHRASSMCLSSSLGRMLQVVGLCSTLLSPSTQFRNDLTSDLITVEKKPSPSAEWYTSCHFYICGAMENNLLFVSNRHQAWLQEKFNLGI